MLKKVRRRYLALTIDSPEKFEAKEFMDAVWNAVLKLYGEYGASKTGLTLISYNEERRFVIIRTFHTAVEMIRAALASITRLADKPAAIHVVKVSGTLRALHKGIVQQQL
ncbi:MAG: Rpp14/Pop5 family protein [Candidatus Bathycorpusculaceae bacterium]